MIKAACLLSGKKVPPVAPSEASTHPLWTPACTGHGGCFEALVGGTTSDRSLHGTLQTDHCRDGWRMSATMPLEKPDVTNTL